MNALHSIQSIYRTALGIVLYTIFALSSAHAETTNCTAITSLPYVISAQGVYCLTGNLSTSITTGYAIEIQANNVTIDMNGFKLGGLAAGDGTETRGIYAFARKNITIKNGIIRGFWFGINFHDMGLNTISQGHVIEDILADQNTAIGITVGGHGNTVRRNQVVDTGGSTVATSVTGISVSGPGNNVLDNQVSTTSTTTAFAFGIDVSGADNAMVKDNRISETVASSINGIGYGIFISTSNDVIARNNLISSADIGILYSNATGLYGGNYTSNVTTPFTGGTAAGTTNYSSP